MFCRGRSLIVPTVRGLFKPSCEYRKGTDMPDVAQVLKAEIRRVARSEIKGQIAAIKGQIRALKKTVRMQRETIATLRKALTTPMSSPRSVQTADDDKTARITPASVKLHRLRLKLSQRQLGQLLGVSTNTIVRWEAGTSRPRAAHRAHLAELRSLGIRAVKSRLED